MPLDFQHSFIGQSHTLHYQIPPHMQSLFRSLFFPQQLSPSNGFLLWACFCFRVLVCDFYTNAQAGRTVGASMYLSPRFNRSALASLVFISISLIFFLSSPRYSFISSINILVCVSKRYGQTATASVNHNKYKDHIKK